MSCTHLDPEYMEPMVAPEIDPQPQEQQPQSQPEPAQISKHSTDTPQREEQRPQQPPAVPGPKHLHERVVKVYSPDSEIHRLTPSATNGDESSRRHGSDGKPQWSRTSPLPLETDNHSGDPLPFAATMFVSSPRDSFPPPVAITSASTSPKQQADHETKPVHGGFDNLSCAAQASAADPADAPLEKYHAAPNPRHSIPWNQRLPGDRSMATSFAQNCGFMMSWSFWVRVELALRNAVLKWLVAALILPNPAWRSYFRVPFQFAIAPLLLSGTRVGHFVAGLVNVTRALAIGLLMSMMVTWADLSGTSSPMNSNVTDNRSSNISFDDSIPTTTMTSTIAARAASTPTDRNRVGQWVGFWSFYVLGIFCIAFFTYGGTITRTAPYFFSAFMLQKWFVPDVFADWSLYSYYLRDTFIALTFAVLPGILPFPRFALHRAEELLSPTANSISIILQGVVASAWTNNTSEQRLDLVRLRQMRAHIRETERKIAQEIRSAWWEPFGSLHLARVKARIELVSKLGTLMSSFVRLVDQLVQDRPDLGEPTSTFSKFGSMLRPQLHKTLDAFDLTLLRLSDCDQFITEKELQQFRVEVRRFEAAVLEARTATYYGEQLTKYQVSTADLYSAHFFFYLESAFDAVMKFKEPSEADLPSRAMQVLDACADTLVGVYDSGCKFPKMCSDEWAIASAKNAVKLASTMAAAASLNYVFDAKNTSAAGILALMHFAESTFSWQQQYVQGLIYGSVFGIIAQHLSGDSYPTTVVLFTALFFVGEFIKTSQSSLGVANAGLLNIAVILLKKSETQIIRDLVVLIAAMSLHLLLTTVLLWPNNPLRALRCEIERSISLFRDGIATLFMSLRPCHIEPAVARALFADTKAALRKSVDALRLLIPAAAAEPTLIGTPFPMPLYNRVLLLLERMEDFLCNCSSAYVTLQSCTVDASPKDKNNLSLHWAMVKVIAAPAQRLADHFSQLTDLLLLVLREGGTAVPTSQLVSMCLQMSQMAVELAHLRNEKVNRIRRRKYARVMKMRALASSTKQGGTHDGDHAGGGLNGDDRRDKNIADFDGTAVADLEQEQQQQQQLSQESDFDDTDDEEDETLQRMFFSEEHLSQQQQHQHQRVPSSAVNSALLPSGARHSRGSSLDHRKPIRKVDPALGADVDSFAIHAVASVLVGAQVIGRFYSELLVSLQDCVAFAEIWSVSGY